MSASTVCSRKGFISRTWFPKTSLQGGQLLCGINSSFHVNMHYRCNKADYRFLFSLKQVKFAF